MISHFRVLYSGIQVTLHALSKDEYIFSWSRLGYFHLPSQLNNFFVPKPNDSSLNSTRCPEYYEICFFLCSILKYELEWEIQRMWSPKPAPMHVNLCQVLHRSCHLSPCYCLPPSGTWCMSVKHHRGAVSVCEGGRIQ